jgi:hypothetical protein
MGTMKQRLGVAAACAMLSSCGVVESPLIPGSSAAAAKDQIMLVRSEPPSFGYRRLSTQVTAHPDLRVFIGQRGLPDFLAETGNSERSYLILYYLKDREAFACRTRAGDKQAVEFAGPYPITDREFKVLNTFRENTAQTPGKD